MAWFEILFGTLLILAAAALLVRVLTRRFGWKTFLIVLGVSLFLGIATSYVFWWIELHDVDRSARVDASWQYIASLEGQAISFEFQPGTGLYAVDPIGKHTLLTDQWPVCMNGGEVESTGLEAVYQTSGIPLYFVPPPQKASASISFEFHYPSELETGYSSFVWFENGEIWCIEKWVPWRSEALAGINLYKLGVFLLGLRIGGIVFIVVLLISFLAIEIHRRRAHRQAVQ